MSASLLLLVGGVLVAVAAVVERRALRVAVVAGSLALALAALDGGAQLGSAAMLVAGAGACAGAGRHRVLALGGATLGLLGAAGPAVGAFATPPALWLQLVELVAIALIAAALVRGQVAAGGGAGSLGVASGALLGAVAASSVVVMGLPTVFVSVAGGADPLAAVAGFSVGESVEVLARDVRVAAPFGLWFAGSGLAAAALGVVGAALGGRRARWAAVLVAAWALAWIGWVIAMASGSLSLGIDLATVAQASQPIGPGRASPAGLYGDIEAIGLVGRGVGLLAAGVLVLASTLDALTTRAAPTSPAPVWQAAGLAAVAWGLVAVADAVGAAPDGFLAHPAGFSLAYAAVAAGSVLLGAGTSRWALWAFGALSGGLLASMLVHVGGGA